MRLIQCILTENDCYKTNQWITPRGCMIHSTGANNPTLKRYVQPLETDEDYDQLIDLLGYNRNQNDWNRPGTNACVHGFIGKLADGSIASIQTLPWNMRGWHAGKGSRGSANDTHISFEICEDGLEDRAYFEAVYQAAVELTASLCRQFDLDPQADGVVICHSEGHARGIASNHADVMHWLPRFGRDMDDFRADVAKKMEGGDDLTEEDVRAIVRSELKQIEADKAALGPDKFGGNADELFRDAVAMGITDGTRPQCGATRQEVALMVRAAVKSTQ